MKLNFRKTPMTLGLFLGLLLCSEVFAQSKVGNASTAKRGESWALRADGGESSGGGPTLVCKNPKNGELSYKLLDTYQGEVVYGFNYGSEPRSIDIEIQKVSHVLGKVSLILQYDFDDAITYLKKNSSIVPNLIISNTVSDLGNGYVIPDADNCKIEYVGYYETSGTLIISKKIYDKLSQRDKVALWVHEALYKLARNFARVNNSGSTRVFNAHLLYAATISESRINFKKLKFLSADFTDRAPEADATLACGGYGAAMIIPNDSKLKFHLTTTKPHEGSGGLEFTCLTNNGSKKYGYTDKYSQKRPALDLSIPAYQCENLTVSFGLYSGGGRIKLEIGSKTIFETVDVAERSNGCIALHTRVYLQRPAH